MWNLGVGHLKSDYKQFYVCVYVCLYVCGYMYVHIYVCVHLTLFYISCFYSAYSAFELFRLGIG